MEHYRKTGKTLNDLTSVDENSDDIKGSRFFFICILLDCLIKVIQFQEKRKDWLCLIC